MCGIFGAVSLNGPFDESAFHTFVRLTDMVSYRGPDDSGYVALKVDRVGANRPEVDRPQANFDVFLGSRRLAIIDLSAAGHQPMHDDGGNWIAFNGEIFNYPELRSELQARGHRFQTGTDTEVILHVYDEFGEGGFQLMNGMWAFILVDTRRRRIVLSRDRFSIKPLYILRLERHLYVASEIKQLLPLLPTRKLNETVMSQFLVQGMLDHCRDTFFSGIRRAPARTNVLIDLRKKEVAEKEYWNFDSSPSSSCDEQDVITRFRELFSDSVRIRLRSDVKTGVLLSGGLDSSAIAVACKEITEAGVQTYSVVSSEKRFSEDTFIDALASSGIANEKVIFGSANVLADLSTAVHHSDEPFGGLSVVAQFGLLRAAKQSTDVTVLLSGQGGDEVLLGYLKFFFFHLRDLCIQGRYARAAREVAGSLVSGTVVHQFTIREAKRYLPISMQKSTTGVNIPWEPVPIWNCRDLRSRQVSDIEFYSVPALTHYEDRNAAAHSLEVRHPFLDHRLVEFLVCLPVEFKIRNGWTKYLLRKSLSELPDLIRWRRDKQPFVTPERMWLKRDLQPALRSLCANSNLERIGVLNAKEFLEHYESFLRGRAIPSAEIARVLIAEIWSRQFLN